MNTEKEKPVLNSKALGKRLELLRNSKGLKKTDAGRLAGVSSQAIGDWEKGKVAPSLLSYLVTLAENYNYDLNLLILGHSQPQAAAESSASSELELLRENRILSQENRALIKKNEELNAEVVRLKSALQKEPRRKAGRFDFPTSAAKDAPGGELEKE